MTATLLDLADATSRNLEFSHRPGVSVSYGEETTTETNLPEISRRHPGLVRVYTFPKHIEAKNGADWEWHIIGRKLTLKMRVQAKRVQCNDTLKIKHVVKSSGEQQRKLLIDSAHISRMKPVYCIYSTEHHRYLWRQYNALSGFDSYHNGCLLAAATDVPLTTRRLKDIEAKRKPWHYLFKRYTIVRSSPKSVRLYRPYFTSSVPVGRLRFHIAVDDKATASLRNSGWNAPTIDHLNGDTEGDFEQTGVEETNNEDLERMLSDTDAGWYRSKSDREWLGDLGICRIIVMDVRNELDFDERQDTVTGSPSI